MTEDRLQNKVLAILPIIIAFCIAIIMRAYRLSNPMDLPGSQGPAGLNGIDEGIHLMSAHLASKGYTLYSDVNPQQGPFIMLVYILLGSDLILSRVANVLISLAGMGFTSLIAYKLRGRTAALVSAVVLTVSYEYLKESRHLSPDLYCSALLAGGFLFLILYLKETDDPGRKGSSGSRQHILLLLCGIFLACATMSKLFGIVPVLGIGVFLLSRTLLSKDDVWRSNRKRWIELGTLVSSTFITAAVLLSIFGARNTLDGILLDNLHRPSQALASRLASLSRFLLFTSVPFILGSYWAVRKRRIPEILLISFWAFPLILLFTFQSLTWDHYFVIVLPPLSILSSFCISDALGIWRRRDNIPYREEKGDPLRKESIFAVLIISSFILFSLFSMGLSSAALVNASEPIEDTIAGDVKEATSPGSMVISGDPLITLLADRTQPPEATNLAKVRYPDITSEELINSTLRNDVEAVVLTYHLSTFTDYVEWVKENFTFHKAYERPGRTSNVEGEVPVGMYTFNLYIVKKG